MYSSIIAWVSCFLILPMLAMGQSCPSLTAHSTTSIFDLHPNDVKVIMAMGDSITTGFGVDNVSESRGVSFSMGGDAGAITLPNFFQYFTPSLVGYSTGVDPAEVCYGTNCPALRYYPNTDADNAAKSGAMVTDMISRQINYLTRQLNQNPYIDVQQDWKVLSIMIGANDLCASCTFNLPYLAPDEFENNLMGTLERVRMSFPRTFVNLVSGFNISQAYDLSLSMSQCNNIARPLFIQCDCLFQPEAGYIREQLDSLITQFNGRAENAAAYYQHKAYDNFAVVVQPFATNTYISDLPNYFLSDLDCFHPSLQGQQAMAVALWNSMLTPAANKKTTLDMSDAPICPTSDTLLYTY